jgi:hypothetical protein
MHNFRDAPNAIYMLFSGSRKSYHIIFILGSSNIVGNLQLLRHRVAEDLELISRRRRKFRGKVRASSSLSSSEAKLQNPNTNFI